MSAVVGKAEIMDSVHAWGLGGTYGGNPVACAAGLAVLEAYGKEDLLAKSVALGEKLKNRFKKWQKQFSLIGEIRGLGAMLGMEFVKGAKNEPAADEANSWLNSARKYYIGRKFFVMENNKKALLQKLRDRTPISGEFWKEAMIWFPDTLRKPMRESKRNFSPFLTFVA